MSYGFKLVSDRGSVIVDDQHITLSVIAQGRMSYANGLFFNSNGGYYVYNDHLYGMLIAASFAQVITSIEPPLVVMIPDGPEGAVHSYQPVGSPGAWTGFEIAFRHTFNLPSGGRYGSIPYINWAYAVVRMDLVPTSADRWGLRVFNEQGAVTFDSGSRALRLLQHFKGWRTTYSGYGYREYDLPWSFPFDRKHGLLVSNMTGFQVYTGNFNFAMGSARFGFSDAGRIRSAVGGLTKLDSDRMGSHGGDWNDGVGRLLEDQSGGPQVFAVKLM
jgi:hypothetical protein|tara:strand:- start:2445 stop:3263 length:819 start_codon:yes stop_codon:yes gene_type:complete